MNTDSLIAGMKQMIATLPPNEQAKAYAMIGEACGKFGGGGTTQAMLPAGQPAGSCPTNGVPVPSLNIPGCPTNVDNCLFPFLAEDLRLFSWPQIEQELWDTDTKINVIVTGAFPVAPGGTVLLAQEARRNLTWVPDCVQINTTWTGTPQPGLLEYQWLTGPKPPVGGGNVGFSNPQNGSQYECGTGGVTTCLKPQFPTYKGADNIPIGALSRLLLQVTLATTATSTLEGIVVVAYHRKMKRGNCCDSCRRGAGTCSCG